LSFFRRNLGEGGSSNNHSSGEKQSSGRTGMKYMKEKAADKLSSIGGRIWGVRYSFN
jgi:hypothetical protein